jgi:hypothetical protein
MSVLTPGLTYHQKQRLADALRRVAGLPRGSIAVVYMDADVAAARALDYRFTTGSESVSACLAIAASIAAEHRIPVDVAACTYGIAVGVRLGRTFAPQPKARSKWISEEYKRLSEPARRDVQQYIRRLLKIQDPPTPKAPASPQEELAAAKRWAREMGHVASGAQRRNKPRQE